MRGWSAWSRFDCESERNLAFMYLIGFAEDVGTIDAFCPSPRQHVFDADRNVELWASSVSTIAFENALESRAFCVFA
jgi:hypothetical protein